METTLNETNGNGNAGGMETGRTGKIARLPHHVRLKLNQRLDDGVSGTDILAWVNELTEVRAMLGRQFGGRPINAQNLSEWRLGGFRDWQRYQTACKQVQCLQERAEELDQAAKERSIGDQMAKVFAAELLTTLDQVMAETGDAAAKLKQLDYGLRHIGRLRRGDHQAARLAMEQEKWERQRVAEDMAFEEAEREKARGRRMSKAMHAVMKMPHVGKPGDNDVVLGGLIGDFVHCIDNDLPVNGVVERFNKVFAERREALKGKTPNPKLQTPTCEGGSDATGEAASNPGNSTADMPPESGQSKPPSNAPRSEMRAEMSPESGQIKPNQGKSNPKNKRTGGSRRKRAKRDADGVNAAEDEIPKTQHQTPTPEGGSDGEDDLTSGKYLSHYPDIENDPDLYRPDEPQTRDEALLTAYCMQRPVLWIDPETFEQHKILPPVRDPRKESEEEEEEE